MINAPTQRSLTSMFESEPNTTAVAVTAVAILLVISVLFSRPSERIGVPVVLVFMLIGLVVGSWFNLDLISFEMGFRIGTVGLVLMLLDRKSTRLNSSHVASSYAVFCLNKQL